jgi:drug/metabolite transporter (DMT)-like permease
MFMGVLISNQFIGICYKSFSTLSAGNQKAAPVFMAIWTGMLGIVLFLTALITNREFIPSAVTWIAALSGGLTFVSAGVLYIRILSFGPFIWSVLMMNLSNFIPVVFALIFLKEPISPPQIAGVLIILSILFIMSVKPKTGDRPFTSKWMLLALITMFVNGSMMSTQKAQSHYMDGAQTLEYLALLFLFTSLFAVSYHLITRITRIAGLAKLAGNENEKDLRERLNRRPLLLLAVGMAAAIGTGNMLGMTLMRYITAAVQFPVIIGGGTILSAFVAVKLYKERPNRRLWLSAGMLIIGVVLLGRGS